jgi:PhzF family phenazine biosynthesis protein
MKSYPYRKVDAFTSKNSRGNPAAYLIAGNSALTTEEMLAFGKEHKGFVSEVVFCSFSDIADVKLTYYSSECEVDFCGHGTIATMYDYIKNHNALREKSAITIDTNKKGKLTVYNHIDDDDSIYITAPKAQWLPIPISREETAVALGIPSTAFADALPFDMIDAGLRTLIVPIKEFNSEVSIYPQLEELRTFCIKNDIDIILTFCMRASSSDYIAHTRVFAPKYGYLEDPATGSGNSAFANYLLKNKMWNGEPTKVEQGGDNIGFNSVRLMKKDEQILFGGSATLRITGEYLMD